MEGYERLTKRNANGEVETVKRPKSSYIQEVYEEWDENKSWSDPEMQKGLRAMFRVVSDIIGLDASEYNEN